jgi:hypothetical protein
MELIDQALSGSNNRVGYISPKFEPIKDLSLRESIQLITRKITIEFCKKYNLILPNFILNILDIYQDYTNTNGQIETRGIIQLYTIYFLLMTISSYWSALTDITSDLLANKDNILKSISVPKPGLKNNSEGRINISEIKNKLASSINSLKSILTPYKESNTTIGIKYFLFKHPININWKFYDTILYHCIILLTIIYNLVYIIKTVNRFDKKQQEKIQLYVYNKKNIRQEVDKKVFQQLFLLFGFMVQHGSRIPFTKEYNIQDVYLTEKDKEKDKDNKTIHNHKSKAENNQQLFNHIENKLQGVNSIKTSTDFKSMGVYTILTTIFKLMYYHPFPFDPLLLEKKLSKNLEQHPVNIANQTRASQLYKIPKSKKFKWMSKEDTEYLSVLGEISDFFGDTLHIASEGLEMMGREKCYIDEKGKKRCNMNELGQIAMMKALKSSSSSSSLEHTMIDEFNRRNRETERYGPTSGIIGRIKSMTKPRETKTKIKHNSNRTYKNNNYNYNYNQKIKTKNK